MTENNPPGCAVKQVQLLLPPEHAGKLSVVLDGDTVHSRQGYHHAVLTQPNKVKIAETKGVQHYSAHLCFSEVGCA